MIYGVYKNIRSAVWQCLHDYKISEMPVDLMKIAITAGISVIKNSEVGELSGGESALCILDKKNQWYLIYDDECTLPRRRIVIGHELGHIFLGHELSKGQNACGFRADNPHSEAEADSFAIRLLSPACVLWALDVHTPADIAKICKIPEVEAKKRAARMKILYERQKFLTTPIETQVFEQFKPFIDENRK